MFIWCMEAGAKLSGLMDEYDTTELCRRTRDKARGEAGDMKGSLDSIRAYWGGMLSLGATTFWEDFDIDWLNNAGTYR